MSIGSHEWDLWSTRARLVVTDGRLLDEALTRARVLLGEIDDAANRFRPDSELSLLPERLAAGDGSARVSSLLADLLRSALRAAADTEGAVDPTVGGSLLDLGYDRDLADVSPAGRMPAVLTPAPGWRRLHLDDDVLHVDLPAERPDGAGGGDLRLDLGATAKARAADLVAERVVASLGVGVLVSLGGDIATAGRGPLGGWQVTVSDDPEVHPVRIALTDGWAIATSSTLHRTWTRGDESLHHIIDPRTGRPASRHWRTVSVAAPTCAEANAVSTAVVVRGADALAWARSRGLPARLVDAAGGVHRAGGWPADQPVGGGGRAA